MNKKEKEEFQKICDFYSDQLTSLARKVDCFSHPITSNWIEQINGRITLIDAEIRSLFKTYFDDVFLLKSKIEKIENSVAAIEIKHTADFISDDEDSECKHRIKDIEFNTGCRVGFCWCNGCQSEIPILVPMQELQRSYLEHMGAE